MHWCPNLSCFSSGGCLEGNGSFSQKFKQPKVEFSASKYLKSDRNGQSSNFVIVICIRTFIFLFFGEYFPFFDFSFSFFEMFLLDLVAVLWGQWWKIFLLKRETHNPIVMIKPFCLNKLITPRAYELLYPFTEFQDPGIGVGRVLLAAKWSPEGVRSSIQNPPGQRKELSVLFLILLKLD